MHDRYRAVDAWVRRLLPATPPAILLGVGSPNDLSMLRSFARRGIPVLHLVSGRLIGSFSRFGVRVRMPPVEWEPEEWLGVLDRIASALGSPAVLFALMDEHCELVARHAERLRGKLRFVVPDAETCAGIIDKRRQYTTAEAASVRVPLTFYPEDVGELASLSPGLAYPVISKPYTSYIGRPQIGTARCWLSSVPTSSWQRLPPAPRRERGSWSSKSCRGRRHLLVQRLLGRRGPRACLVHCAEAPAAPRRVRRRLPAANGRRARGGRRQPPSPHRVPLSRARHGRVQT